MIARRFAFLGRALLSIALGGLPAITASVHCVAADEAAVAADETADEAFDEAAAPMRGLTANFTANGRSLTLLQDRVFVDEQHPFAAAGLPLTGPVSARWEGTLLVRDAAPLQLHADVSGRLTLNIDGQPVLAADAPERRFLSGDTLDLAPGDHRVSVAWESGRERRLNLFWSSSSFTLEPIPGDAFFLDARRPRLAAAARGRELADARRCAACHVTPENLTPLAAPALDRVADSQPWAVLVERLRDPRTVVENSHMPDFGLHESEATAVAAFLHSVSRSTSVETDVTAKDDDVAAGRGLLLSLGCAACHRVADAGPAVAAEPWDAPELVTLHRRRSRGWIDRWLQDPASLNPAHRMPVIDLTKEERRQLVAVLSAGSDASNRPGAYRPEANLPSVSLVSAERVAAGRELVDRLNCAACHAIPGLEPAPRTPLMAVAADSASTAVDAGREGTAADDGSIARSCVRTASATGRPHQPRFSVTATDRRSLSEWLQTVPSGDRDSDGRAVPGRVLLQRNGCVACHDRDSVRGLSAQAATLAAAHPDLRGRSQGLIPPALTAVGDKLTDATLRIAVAGAQKQRRLPWLQVRMPEFSHTDQERDELVRALISADRIPDAADAVRGDILADTQPDDPRPATDSELLIANQLTGAAGFNCVACHSAGRFEPRNVALGTRGSDLMTMGSRLRTRFFLRWMKNPIRVVPGIEMPAIRRAAPGVQHESLPDQIAMIWRALQDDGFTPPTVTSRFEQALTVHSDDPPAIIRDVFTIGDGQSRTAVARALAVGLPNGHSLLIDLDTLQFMQWTFGDFARQRTEGKSWYWDLAGVTIALADGDSPDFQLRMSDGRTLHPVIDEARIAELTTYRIDGDTLTFTCRLHFRERRIVTESESDDPHADATAWTNPEFPTTPVTLQFRIRPAQQAFRDNAARGTGDRDARGDEAEDPTTGWTLTTTFVDGPAESVLELQGLPRLQSRSEGLQPAWQGAPREGAAVELTRQGAVELTATVPTVRVPSAEPEIPVLVADPDAVTTVPGFDGVRLPLATSIMPTAIVEVAADRIAFTSLKGHVWHADDSDGDGLPDRLSQFEEGLAAPFGLLQDGADLLVAHKPEVLRLRDTDGDGRADTRQVIAAGWGYSDNYHDWATGMVPDGEGNLFVGLGSDYSVRNRSAERDRWRGGVVRIDSSGHVSPVAMAFRYPMGLAIDADGRLFATDNQGVQNTFNEINLIRPGGRYGVPSRFDRSDVSSEEIPALAVPHPWARSVNAILFLPDDYPLAPLRGHGIGCEYDNRFLMRFTTQIVNGELQGASYRFSLPQQPAGGENFIGPICAALGREGTLYVGSIRDSGWQGGQNTGGITRLSPSAAGLPNGIREVRATPAGFEVEFFASVDAATVADPAAWSIRSYTRNWSGQYATPDSDERSRHPDAVVVSGDRHLVQLHLPDLQPRHMYDVVLVSNTQEAQSLWPSTAHYWMKVVPRP